MENKAYRICRLNKHSGVDFHSAVAMYRSNVLFFVKNFLKNNQKPSVYNALSHFCVIMTRASTRRTIPVAFILSISFYDTFDGRQVAAPTLEMLVRACRGGDPPPAGSHRPVAVPCVRLRCTQTAATRSGRCIRHRRRSHRSPTIILQITLLVSVKARR